MKTLHMVLDGQDVGRLTQDGHGSTRVTATPTDGLPRVSLAFPSNGEPVKPKPTQAYLAGLLPDNERTRMAIADRHGVSPTSEFALIGAIGADCPGAIQFLTDDQRENPPAEDLEPITDHAIAERLRGFRSGGADWGAAGEHWSLGGAQSKFALRFEGGAWHQAAGAAATSHIIKPGIIGYDEQALIEHVSLAALRELGMNVAATEFVRFEDEPAIVIERFDRIYDDAGTLRRAHQEDLCQSTSTLPGDKYKVTPKKAIGALRGGGASEDIIYEFVSAMIANWVLGAPDAHAKNYSIILGPTGVEALTPLYDVATGLGYPNSNEVAMGFDREKRMYKITGQHLLDFARANALDGEFLLQLARTMAALMPAAFATAAEATMAAAQLTGGDMSRLRSTTELLIEHCRKVGVLISQVE